MNPSVDKDDESKTKKTNTLYPIVIAILISLGVFFGGIFISHWYANNHFIVKSNTKANKGENTDHENAPALFGDSAGAVNALISAFAFAGVIVSMYLQRKDLELQREALVVQQKELTQNTQALRSQQKEFETQNKTMKLQRFENTFFNMLSLQQEIVNNLKHSYDKQIMFPSGNIRDNESITTSGRQVFEHLYTIDLKPTIEQVGIGAFNTIDLNLFDHYFLHIYRIMKFVDETNLLDNKSEKYSYISILRSTLSRYELVYLFYNELNPDYAHFKELIEEYSLFNNLNKSTLVVDRNIPIDKQLDMYERSAINSSIKGYNRPIKS